MQVIELFAGAGGLGLGVSRAGFKTALVVERDRFCCDTIRENQARKDSEVKNWPLFDGDVRDCDFSKFEGKLALLTGGPPCQPFSLGGRHQAHRDERDMFPEAVRALREARPKAFIFENVKGLTRSAFATYFEYIRLQMTHPECVAKSDEDWTDHLSRLERLHTRGARRGLHYNVVTRVLNAANYGIPQRRERVFFVGFRADLGVQWQFPDASHSLESLLWDQTKGEYWNRHDVSKKDRTLIERYKVNANGLKVEPTQKPWLTVRDAIADLPDPERQPRAADAWLNHRFQSGARAYPGHTGSPLDMPAKTLKAGVHGVPGGENMLARPDGSVRYFTVRESARLQTFPDHFIFHGSWSETMRQLGNAVPVTLAELIASNVREYLTDATMGRS